MINDFYSMYFLKWFLGEMLMFSHIVASYIYLKEWN